MKTIKIKHLFLALITLVWLGSCTEDELVKLNPDASIDAVASESELELSDELEGTDVLTVSWPEPDYGFSAAPVNVIYLDTEEGAFGESAETVNIGTDISKTFEAAELNRILIKLGFEPGEAAHLIIKVVSKMGTYNTITSETMTVNVTAYTAFLDLSTTWGVVGSAYNNWGDFPDAPFFTTSVSGEYVAYVTVTTGKIKFRENNAWDHNMGDNGADGTLEDGGADIDVTAGHKKIVFNPTAGTYSISEYSWGIVGSAYNDWGAAGPDFKFTYDDATDQWRAIVKLMTGKFKIRKNNDWGLNYGDTGADGTLEEGGTDIDITAGKYQITFNEKLKTIVIEPVDAIWGLVGSAYNDWGAAGPDAAFIRDYRTEGAWVLKNVRLIAGKFKIRDSNDWGLNYGDTGANGSLEVNGTDIDTGAGIFTVTIDFTDPANPTWSSVKHHD